VEIDSDKESLDEDDGVDDSSDAEDISSSNLYHQLLHEIAALRPAESYVGVFSAQTIRQVNLWAAVLGGILKHQSDSDYQYASFDGGLFPLPKKHGHEERCVILVLLLIFCSKQGKDVLENPMGNARMSLFILVHSLMLLLEDFFLFGIQPKVCQ
jgi:hypothetical protein